MYVSLKVMIEISKHNLQIELDWQDKVEVKCHQNKTMLTSWYREPSKQKKKKKISSEIIGDSPA